MQEPKKQHKVRRFIWRVLKYTTLCVLLLLISVFFLFQMHSVQTWLGKKASSYLSKELKTTIDIKTVKINFFKNASNHSGIGVLLIRGVANLVLKSGTQCGLMWIGTRIV